MNSANGIIYHSCTRIEQFFLNLSRDIFTGELRMRLCCEPNIDDIPLVIPSGEPEESMKRFAIERADNIAESVKFSQLSATSSGLERKHTAGCAKCVHYQPHNWGGDGLIHNIGISIYPAPCQGKCIYCDAREHEVLFKTVNSESYEYAFEMLEYAQISGMIASDATWYFSSGEISIHPFKERMLNILGNQAAVFFTNGFVFDEQIASNLAANPFSRVYHSIDSGTSETWRKIKGVDNFYAVIENLKKYSTCAARPGQVSLKYIILPGQNDDPEDYLSVIKIMKSLQVSHLEFSCDLRQKYSRDESQQDELIRSAGYLAALLFKNEMTMNLNENPFSPGDEEKVTAFAQDIIKSGQV